jgi:hypothetical protein
LERLLGNPVEDSQAAEAVVVEGDLGVGHQAALLVVAVVLLLPAVLVGPLVVPFQVRQEVPDHRKGHRLGLVDLLRWRGSPHRSPTGLVQVPALVFGGGFVVVGFSDLLLVDIAGGVVAMTGQPLVETTLSTHWSQLWRKGRNLEPVVVVSPSGSMLVGLAEVCWRVMVIGLVRGSGQLLFVQ